MEELINLKKILVSLAIILSISCAARAQDIVVKIKKQKASMNENFRFSVFNATDSVIDYYVSMDVYNDSTGWELLKEDIFDTAARKLIRLYKVPPRKNSEHHFSPMHIRPASFIPKNYLRHQLCRIKISYTFDGNCDFNAVHSKSFTFF